MKTYLDMLKYVIKHGKNREDRTGVGTRSVFGYQARYNLQNSFPAVTTKKLMFHSVLVELLWFLRGDTNVKYLQDCNVKIWNEWADANGNLGPVYGCQWRSWPGYDKHPIDQIKRVIEQIKTNPNSRRLLVSAWNVAMLEEMALPPCHVMFQFYVSGDKLSCHLYQRSGDIFLGVPFNIASYSLLTYMIAQVTNLKPYEFIHTIGDLHLYLNHQEAAKTQLARKPFSPPTLQLNSEISHIDKFTVEDIKLLNYRHHDAIRAPIAV